MRIETFQTRASIRAAHYHNLLLMDKGPDAKKLGILCAIMENKAILATGPVVICGDEITSDRYFYENVDQELKKMLCE